MTRLLTENSYRNLSNNATESVRIPIANREANSFGDIESIWRFSNESIRVWTGSREYILKRDQLHPLIFWKGEISSNGTKTQKALHAITRMR